MHGLDAVAVGVEEKAAVVVGVYCGLGPGSPSLVYPASTPRLQKASTSSCEDAAKAR
jgi:hypothetical protein